MDKDELIKKWLKDELSDAEKEVFQELDDTAFNALILDYAKHFKASNHTELTDFSSFKSRYENRKKPLRRLLWFSPALKIASIIIVALGFYFALLHNPQTTIQTLAKETTKITLPDNSLVELNQLSELAYHKNEWKEQRELELKGEAFFDVEKGKQFDVNTKFGKVSVLGTAFNVLSRDSIFKVSCYEGLVQVVYNDDEVKLPAGTEFILTSGKGLKSTIATAEPYWIKNMSVFESASFKSVVEELEDQYKIKVQFPSDLDVKFTGAFEHNNLKNALKAITTPLNLTYIIQNNTEVIIKNGQH